MLQRVIPEAPVVVGKQVPVHVSDVCGSERLSKRVYGEASFIYGGPNSCRSATRDCKGTGPLYLLKLALLQASTKPARSCKLNPPRLGHVGIEDFDREADSHKL